MQVELTAEKQKEIIEGLQQILIELSKDEPNIAGGGHITDALDVLCSNLSVTILFAQRTYVIARFIADTLTEQDKKFVRNS